MPIPVRKTLNAQAGMLVAPISQFLPTLRDGVPTEKRKPSDDWMNRTKEFLKDARSDREREELLVRVKDGLTAIVEALTKLSNTPATVDGITASQGHTKAAIAAWKRVIPSIEPYEKLRGRKLEFKSPWNTVKQLDMDAVLRALEWVELGFDRLAYYRTKDGEAWLLSVLGFSDEPLSLPPGLMRVSDSYVLNSVHPWGNELQTSAEGLQTWLTEVFKPNNAGVDIATGAIKAYLLDTYELKVRLSKVGSATTAGAERSNQAGTVRGANLVRIRTSSTYYPNLGTVPRMYTFQVRLSSASDPNRPHKKHEWGSAAEHHEKTDALPILRYVHATTMASRGNGDFLEGVVYAMDGPSRLYCGTPTRKHTALLEGCPAAAAGVLVAKKGRVIAIDNRSGHYKPGYAELRVAVRYLRAQGLFDPAAVVALLVDPCGAVAYFTVTDFLQLAENRMQFAAVASVIARTYPHKRGAPSLIAAAREYIENPDSHAPKYTAMGSIQPPGQVDSLLCYMYSEGGARLIEIVDETMTLLRTVAGITAEGPPPISVAAYRGTVTAGKDPKAACAELYHRLWRVPGSYAVLHSELAKLAPVLAQAPGGAPNAAAVRQLSTRLAALQRA